MAEEDRFYLGDIGITQPKDVLDMTRLIIAKHARSILTWFLGDVMQKRVFPDRKAVKTWAEEEADETVEDLEDQGLQYPNILPSLKRLFDFHHWKVSWNLTRTSGYANIAYYKS